MRSLTFATGVTGDTNTTFFRATRQSIRLARRANFRAHARACAKLRLLLLFSITLAHSIERRALASLRALADLNTKYFSRRARAHAEPQSERAKN